MFDRQSLKAWIITTHDSIVMSAVDMLMSYAEGAYRREAERLHIMELLRDLHTPKPILLLTGDEVAEALTRWREQEERDEFFGDTMPPGTDRFDVFPADEWPMTGRVADGGDPE